VVEADALDQLADRQAIPGHDGAELVAGGVPADMPAFQHGDAGPQPRRLQRDRQACEPGAYDANIDVEIEGQPRTIPRCGIAPASGSLTHVVFLRALGRVVTLFPAMDQYINLVRTNRVCRPCAV